MTVYSEGVPTTERTTAHRMEEIFREVSNWGRWGADDQRGLLNLITDEEGVRGAELVRHGHVVSCGLDLQSVPALDTVPYQHMMLTSGDALGEKAIPGYQETNDYLGIACHGLATTHIDALCHVFIDGRMYNGYGREYVRTTGAERNSIGGAAGGIVGRGVLMDIPRLRGTEWLDPGDAITPEELDAAATEQQTPVRQGDILIVSTGRQERRASEGERRHYRSGLAGLHPECLIWLHQRSVAVLGSDGVSDPAPNNAAEGWPVPIHQCGISGMGLHLIDNMALAELAAVCARLGQWDFLFAIAPLRAQGATASPVNPLAVL